MSRLRSNALVELFTGSQDSDEFDYWDTMIPGDRETKHDDAEGSNTTFAGPPDAYEFFAREARPRRLRQTEILSYFWTVGDIRARRARLCNRIILGCHPAAEEMDTRLDIPARRQERHPKGGFADCLRGLVGRRRRGRGGANKSYRQTKITSYFPNITLPPREEPPQELAESSAHTRDAPSPQTRQAHLRPPDDFGGGEGSKVERARTNLDPVPRPRP